ncbi:MAG: hypothetical protein ACJAYU_001918 [Bradymonadia bacterium]|jgi:hypothetical protein
MYEPVVFSEELACTEVGIGGDGNMRCEETCRVDTPECELGVTPTTDAGDSPIHLLEVGERSDDEGWIRASGTTSGADLVHNGSCSEELGREVVFVWIGSEGG